jgi:hypothetical protein
MKPAGPCRVGLLFEGGLWWVTNSVGDQKR